MRLSVVIPLLNEQDNLRLLHAQLKETLLPAVEQLEIIFVDDGSTDHSADILRQIAAEDSAVRGLIFSRNFGHEAASTAGLDAATGDAIVLMDADLQDPPAIIVEMIQKWKEGNQIVVAVRRTREGETFFKRFTAWLFYRIFNYISDVPFPKDAGDFRLIDRSVADALKQMREQDRFVRGLVAWTGYKTARVEYDRPARHAGKTKYNPIKLFLLSLDVAVGFSTKPLRLATALGFVVMVISLEEGLRIFIEKIFQDIPIPGYALNTVGLFFLGGVQMLLLGVIGEYIGRIYRHSQNRPLYIVAQRINDK